MFYSRLKYFFYCIAIIFITNYGHTQTTDSLNFNKPDSLFKADTVLVSLQVPSARVSPLQNFRKNTTNFYSWNKVYEYIKLQPSPNVAEMDTIINLQSDFSSSYFCYLYLSNAKRFASNYALQQKAFSYRFDKMDQIVDNAKQRYLFYLNQNFMSYSPPKVSNKIIKSIGLTIENDILQKVIKNEDRNYTGGGRLEIVTDFMKLRLFDIFSKRNIISYQTIFVGGEAYTPRVQYEPEEVERAMHTTLSYQNGDLTDASFDTVKKYLDSIHRQDRPFASFYFVGRSKYRMHIRGGWRLFTEFKIGLIGTQGPKNIQAFIHRDITNNSKKILLWENQIADGGRYIFNFNNRLDLRIFSSTKAEENKIINTSSNNASWGNHIYLPIQFNIGTEVTSAATGIRWQNRSIRDVNGQNELIHNNPIAPNKLFSFLKRLMFLSVDAQVKYVFHNSMLEGVGIFNTFKNDPFDDDKNSYRELSKNEVSRWVFTSRLQTVLRFKNSSLTYAMTILSPEFKLAEAKWYAYGTIGFNFLL